MKSTMPRAWKPGVICGTPALVAPTTKFGFSPEYNINEGSCSRHACASTDWNNCRLVSDRREVGCHELDEVLDVRRAWAEH